MAVDRSLITRPEQALTEADEIQQMLADEMNRDGERQAFELKPPRFGISSQLQLFVNKLTNDTYKTLEGVVIFSREVSGYWIEGEKAPVCSSTDGINGIPRGSDHSQRCAACKFNQWGSDQKGGRGKACKQMRRLIVQLEQSPIPVILSIPPTSINAFDEYCSGLVTSKPQRTYFAVITKMALDKVSNPDGQDYSKVRFEKVRNLIIEEMYQVRKWRDEFQKYVTVEIEADDYSTTPSNGNGATPNSDYANEPPPWEDDAPPPETPPEL
ncbi:MAG: hypothetical protein M1343_08155 [Chloroflexi bacterium]|nr:hypothetical protein [Chloroflexota bacterium]